MWVKYLLMLKRGKEIWIVLIENSCISFKRKKKEKLLIKKFLIFEVFCFFFLILYTPCSIILYIYLLKHKLRFEIFLFIITWKCTFIFFLDCYIYSYIWVSFKLFSISFYWVLSKRLFLFFQLLFFCLFIWLQYSKLYNLK